MVSSEQYEDLEGLAVAAARRVASSWPDAIEHEDITQEILVRLVESPGALTRIFEEDEVTRKAFLIKMGHQVASQLFQDYERFSGNYTYDTARVRKLLELGSLQLDQEKFTPDIVDMHEGLANLKRAESTYFAELVNRFVHLIEPDRKDTAAHMRISRAVESLTAHMNRIGEQRRKDYTEGPGTRFVKSNRFGQNASSADWQGELSEGRH